jgi:hypothetical protein
MLQLFCVSHPPPQGFVTLSSHNRASLKADYRLAPRLGLSNSNKDVKDRTPFIRDPNGIVWPSFQQLRCC